MGLNARKVINAGECSSTYKYGESKIMLVRNAQIIKFRGGTEIRPKGKALRALEEYFARIKEDAISCDDKDRLEEMLDADRMWKDAEGIIKANRLRARTLKAMRGIRRF